jgi:hypothetical protein
MSSGIIPLLIPILSSASKTARLYEGPQKETPENFQKLEERIMSALPADYKEVLTSFGACALEGEEESIIFLSIADMLEGTRVANSNKLTGVHVFATDNGGEYYFYDIHNQSGQGKFSVFRVYPGNLSWDDSVFIAQDLTQLVGKIISGEDFSEYKNNRGN